MPRIKQKEDDYKNNDLRGIILQYKSKAELTQAEVAKACGICPNSLSRYLKDPGKIPLSTIRAIQKTLNIPKAEMFKLLI